MNIEKNKNIYLKRTLATEKNFKKNFYKFFVNEWSVSQLAPNLKGRENKPPTNKYF